MNDKPETGTLAIEITSETSWNMLKDIFPSFRQLSFRENVGRFVIPNYKGDGPTIIAPATVPEYFDHIATTSAQLKVVSLVE